MADLRVCDTCGGVEDRLPSCRWAAAPSGPSEADRVRADLDSLLAVAEGMANARVGERRVERERLRILVEHLRKSYPHEACCYCGNQLPTADERRSALPHACPGQRIRP